MMRKETMGREIFAVGLGFALLFAVGAESVDARTVIGTLRVDNSTRAGTDGNGRVLLFAPNPVNPGSSISHFDSSAMPDLLMEPNNSPNQTFGALDLTRPQMLDIGWNAGSSNIQLRIADEANQGFNDPALGGQRLQAMQFAAGIWAGVLRSSVTLNVEIRFRDLDCSNGSGVLAQAGPQFIFDDFPGAPVGGTWYHGALAEALSGQNLSLQDTSNADAGELALTFNSRIDQACLGSGSRYYYGTNGNTPQGAVNFVQVALHEMAHGLGFSSLIDETNGALFLGRPDIFSRFILDNTRGLRWHQMTPGQRVASAVNTGNLAWAGNRVTSAAPSFLQPAPAFTISEPDTIAGRYQISTAEFGPAVSNNAISGEIIQATDGSTAGNQACGAIVNGSELAGGIALIDRGACNFTVKVRNAQNVGARAVVIVNNEPGAPIPMGGDDNSIGIPSVMISQADGNRIKAALAEPPPFDPGTLSWSTADVQVDETGGNLSLTVRRTQGSDGDVTVDYETVEGSSVTSATAGEDFQTTSGTLTFSDGDDGDQTVSVRIFNDDASEETETFTVRLFGVTGGASLGSPATLTVSIVDDEPCIVDEQTLCLQGGRFRVRVDWRDADNVSGVGTVVPGGTDDSSLFWFFEQDNWELLVKLLNGCGINQRYWVFAAATTDVEYNLRVTDTQTGASRVYTNPLGTASDAVTDGNAFATCP